jgi:hypothetical protein
MNRLILAAVLAAGFVTGCKEGSSVAPSTNPNKPGEVRKLEVKSPGSQTVTQDQTDEFTVDIDRHNFKGPITIKIDQLPTGVKVVTQDLTIPEGKDSVTVTIKADATATPTDKHKVRVTASGSGMPEASTDFELTVKAK